MKKQLRLHQEILLLSLRDKEGTIISAMHAYSIAAAMLCELLLLGKASIDDKKTKLFNLTDSKVVGTSFLFNEVIVMIAGEDKPKPVAHWLVKISAIPKLTSRAADELCDMKILRRESNKILWVFEQESFPEVTHKVEKQLKIRMQKLMFGQTIMHDERTTALIALAKRAGLLPYNFDKDRLHRNQDRINKIADGTMFAARNSPSTAERLKNALSIFAISIEG